MIKELTNNLVALLHQDNKKGEFARFAIVGVIAAIIHYVIYFVLYHIINVSVAYTIGYILSWFCNLYLTSRFTFHQEKCGICSCSCG